MAVKGITKTKRRRSFKRKRSMRKRRRGDEYSLYKSIKNTPELKAFDVQQGSTNWSTAGTTQYLMPLVNGTGVSNRIGSKVTVKSISLKLLTFLDAAFLAGNAAQFRFGIYLDKQPNAAQISYGSLYLPETGTTSAIAPRNLVTRDRVQILYEEDFVMDADSYNVAFNKCYKKVKIPITYFETNAGTIADIMTNAIGFFGCYFPNSIIPALPTYQFQSRIRYTDM